MATKILMLLTSTGRLGESDQPTGVWLEELAAPYWAFVDAGFEVRLASVRGGSAPLDPMSLGDPWITAAGHRFLQDPNANAALATTARIDNSVSVATDAIFLVGGAGCAYDFPREASIAALVSRVARDKGVVAGICHGVLGLTDAKAENGALLVAGRRVTGISNAEESAVGYDKVLPLLPENELKRAGASFEAAEPFVAFIVRDGRLLTGQNPASAASLARAVIEGLS